jgi:hypothetical protein
MTQLRRNIKLQISNFKMQNESAESRHLWGERTGESQGKRGKRQLGYVTPSYSLTWIEI